MCVLRIAWLLWTAGEPLSYFFRFGWDWKCIVSICKESHCFLKKKRNKKSQGKKKNKYGDDNITKICPNNHCFDLGHKGIVWKIMWKIRLLTFTKCPSKL